MVVFLILFFAASRFGFSVKVGPVQEEAQCNVQRNDGCYGRINVALRLGDVQDAVEQKELRCEERQNREENNQQTVK